MLLQVLLCTRRSACGFVVANSGKGCTAAHARVCVVCAAVRKGLEASHRWSLISDSAASAKFRAGLMERMKAAGAFAEKPNGAALPP